MTIMDWIRGWMTRRKRTIDLSSPDRVARAADLLEENGRLQEASVILGEGLKRFPQASSLRAQQERVERGRLRERSAELAKIHQARPDPALALELVRICRQTGDPVSARRVADDAIGKFPNHAPLHQALGDLWSDIFDHSGTEQDGAEAMRGLERCVELDPANVSAREALVVLYGKIGAWGKALHHAVIVLNTLRPGAVGRVAMDALAHHTAPQEDVGVLMHGFARSREKTSGSPPEGKGVTKTLEQFHDLRGRRVAAILAPDGSLVELLSSERVDKDALAKCGNALSAVAGECCSRMSIGAFVMAQIEGPGASAYLKALAPPGADEGQSHPGRAATVFVLTNDSARRREVLARLARI